MALALGMTSTGYPDMMDASVHISNVQTKGIQHKSMDLVYVHECIFLGSFNDGQGTGTSHKQPI